MFTQNEKILQEMLQLWLCPSIAKILVIEYNLRETNQCISFNIQNSFQRQIQAVLQK